LATREEEFLQRLLATFRVEAGEHVAAMSSGLIELEQSPPEARRRELVEIVYREAHSLKGAARSVNLTEIELLCQAMEGLLAALKREEVPLSPAACDLLLEALDAVNGLLLGSAEEGQAERQARLALRERLGSAARGVLPGERPDRPAERPADAPPPSPLVEPEPLPRRRSEDRIPPPAVQPPAGPVAPGADTIRIPKHKLDALLLQVEELIAIKLIARRHAGDARSLRDDIGRWSEAWDRVYPTLRRIAARTHEGGPHAADADLDARTLRVFLDGHAPAAHGVSTRLAQMKKTFDIDSRAVSTMLDSLFEDIKEVLMFPCATLLDQFPKVVRDLAREQEKEIDFRISGGATEVDNRILQEMKDPLMHIVRNCVDHGIESPGERARKRKSPRGKLSISVSRTDGGKIEILVFDDGGGIDPERVKGAAVSKGIVSPEEASRMSRDEAVGLIFRSGFSTSPKVTTLSGRGLGLAIVREKIEKLGGTVDVETHSDSGTTFRIHIPMTMAAFRGTLVRVGARIFAIPTTNVSRALSLPVENVKRVENVETVELHGKAASLVRLGTVLGIPEDPRDEEAKDVQLVVLGTGNARIAFKVDEVMSDEEIILKGLGRQLSRVRNVAGATVLASGRVVLVLNVSDLLKSAVQVAGRIAQVSAAPAARGRKRKSILVVEDSITARTLLKNILVSAGYAVVTAIDGVDGFTALQSNAFDLVVSDVQMPRMDGFELTEKIRAKKAFADLPVILVTGLESAEDRKRGVEAGANAYIVKSSFDQGDLLSAIRRMI
jgi:two-component system chemotaxis sensor kinase CheA